MGDVEKKQVVEAIVPEFLKKLAEAYEDGWVISRQKDGQVDGAIHRFPSMVGVTVERRIAHEKSAETSEKDVDSASMLDSVEETVHTAEKPKRTRQAQK